MMKRLIAFVLLFVVIAPIFVVGDSDCPFFCKLNKFLWGDAALRENLAGKAG